MSTNNAEPTIGNKLGNMQNAAVQGANVVTDTLGNMRDNVNAQVKEFSTKASTFSTKEFLDSNTLIAKLAFLILVLIGFMILMYLGIALITYFTSTSNSPYLIRGLNDGTNYKIIPQDPKNSQAIPIMRSNNRTSGIEFTWSVWLKTMDTTSSKTAAGTKTYNHVFSKGGNGKPYEGSNIMKINNAPGVYFVQTVVSSSGTGSDVKTVTQTDIVIFMNTASENPTNDINTISESITITNVPIKSWFNLVIRLENKVMDVYINGTLTQRHVFTNIPIQNYDDVFVCANGGFTGTMSDLRYFDHALNVFEINNIVSGGPNLTYIGGSKDSTSQLSSVWYNTNSNA